MTLQHRYICMKIPGKHLLLLLHRAVIDMPTSGTESVFLFSGGGAAPVAEDLGQEDTAETD